MRLRQAHREFLRGYFSTHARGKKTEAAYASDLAQFLLFAGKEKELLAVDGTLIERWAAHLRERAYKHGSIRRKIVVLKVFCSYWVRKGVLAESPFWRIRLSFGRIEQLPRTLTEDEMRALLSEARKLQHGSAPSSAMPPASATLRASDTAYRNLRNLALVDLLFATGVRVGEESSLDIKDFWPQDAMFRVRGKGGRDRLAFTVDKNSLEIQRRHLQCRMAVDTESPALFLNARGQRLSTQGISGVLSQLRLDAGIARHITPHMLRHTGATRLLRHGGDLRVGQEFH